VQTSSQINYHQQTNIQFFTGRMPFLSPGRLEETFGATSYYTFAACFSQSSEDAPLQTLLTVTPSSVFCRACEVTCHNRTR